MLTFVILHTESVLDGSERTYILFLSVLFVVISLRVLMRY